MKSLPYTTAYERVAPEAWCGCTHETNPTRLELGWHQTDGGRAIACTDHRVNCGWTAGESDAMDAIFDGWQRLFNNEGL